MKSIISKLKIKLTSLNIAVLLTLLSMYSHASGNTPSGTCGGLIDINHKNIQTSEGMKNGTSALIHINFDSLIMSGRGTEVTYHNTPLFPTYKTNILGPIPFTIKQGEIPSIYILTPESGSGMPTFAIMPINGGLTFLLQAQNDRGSGVCQK